MITRAKARAIDPMKFDSEEMEIWGVKCMVAQIRSRISALREVATVQEPTDILCHGCAAGSSVRGRVWHKRQARMSPQGGTHPWHQFRDPAYPARHGIHLCDGNRSSVRNRVVRTW